MKRCVAIRRRDGVRQRYHVGRKARFRAPLKIIDPRTKKFGSIEWQDAMVHNIEEKQKHEAEELGPAEYAFLEVEKERQQRKNRMRANLRPDLMQTARRGRPRSIVGFASDPENPTKAEFEAWSNYNTERLEMRPVHEKNRWTRAKIPEFKLDQKENRPRIFRQSEED